MALKPVEAKKAHWQIAMKQLIDAAEGRNFNMHARIGEADIARPVAFSHSQDPKQTKTDQFEVFVIGGGKYVPLATPPIGP